MLEQMKARKSPKRNVNTYNPSKGSLMLLQNSIFLELLVMPLTYCVLSNLTTGGNNPAGTGGR